MPCMQGTQTASLIAVDRKRHALLFSQLVKLACRASCAVSLGMKPHLWLGSPACDLDKAPAAAKKDIRLH